ncbi:MAG: Unknown protein [uncultured Aureispira sp.]|uniref:Uncharacterized protein n=1 Tax=uncultured Aureispira sp. TaxID=1331704 RepID=A0A6S6SY84_9BACT|nr:MAG: Unknown protein [uncultured Aureispira sp.]
MIFYPLNLVQSIILLNSALFYKLIFGNIGWFVNGILNKRLNYKCNISLTVCPKRKERGNALMRNLSLFPKRTKYFSIYSYKGKKKN